MLKLMQTRFEMTTTIVSRLTLLSNSLTQSITDSSIGRDGCCSMSKCYFHKHVDFTRRASK